MPRAHLLLEWWQFLEALELWKFLFFTAINLSVFVSRFQHSRIRALCINQVRMPVVKKLKSAHELSGSRCRPQLIPVSVAWSDKEYFYSPLDGMLVHRRVITSIKFAGTHLYTWVERGTVRVKCLAREQNAITPAVARTRTARCGDERTNHEAIALPLNTYKSLFITREVKHDV